MKELFSDDYPAAATLDGKKMPLRSERRWVRIYATKDSKSSLVVSRFMDGSAGITFQQLVDEWPRWNWQERQDFCGACSWLKKRSDFPEMMRFIMQTGGPDDWTAIALCVAEVLPVGEAFVVLKRSLDAVELDEATNLLRGIAKTKHPEAEAVLRAHLALVWRHPALWDDDEFTNWYAYSATCIIHNLVKLGVPVDRFADQVQQLATHRCNGNRDSCQQFLEEYYPWISGAADPKKM